MKLLGKKTVSIEVAAQRKNQIDEGMQLAQKIDTLRKTHSDLQSQHTDFIAGMQVELRKATDHLAIEVATKKKELELLEEKRLILLTPLNGEWNKLNHTKVEIEVIKQDLYDRTVLIKQKENRIEENLKKSKDSLVRIKTRETELERSFASTEKLREETALINSKAKNEKQQRDEESQKFLKEIELEKNKVKFEKEANENLKERLLYREKELNQKERQINDRYQTLERTLSRNKKQK